MLHCVHLPLPRTVAFHGCWFTPPPLGSISSSSGRSSARGHARRQTLRCVSVSGRWRRHAPHPCPYTQLLSRCCCEVQRRHSPPSEVLSACAWQLISYHWL